MRSPLRVRLAVSLALIAATPAFAFDFVPTRYDDPVPDGCLATDCSLREALIAANAGADDDRILLSAGVYTLSLVGAGENFSATGDLDVTKNVEILGVGPGLTVLDAAGLGEEAIVASEGGLVFALRKLTIRKSVADGVLLGVGNHTVEECEFRENGGNTSYNGLHLAVGAVATIRRSSFVDNVGRGLNATQCSATIENSTISHNGGQELIVNQVVSFSCTHCTIADAGDDDLEVFAINNSALSFANSIVAGDCLTNSGATIGSLGGNVESPGNTCNFVQGSDLNAKTSVELDLGALADNGGPTPTCLPGVSSVAIANAIDVLSIPVGPDQRSVARVGDNESGAVELTGVHVETPIFIDGFLQGNPGAWSDAVGVTP